METRCELDMKILVLGATGMLGHKMVQVLGKKHDVTGTVRRKITEDLDAMHPVFSQYSMIDGVTAENVSSVETAISFIKPDVVINCIGIVKQLQEATDPIKSITVNALFPHQLANICKDNNAWLIHISTDCVYSGNKGNYSETDPSDAEDLYGKTKALGEVNTRGCMTLRTSIIGTEIETKHGLIEWFLSRQGPVIGYKNAIFSGVTTNALADIVDELIVDQRGRWGIFNVASEPISKYDLLVLIKRAFGTDFAINKGTEVVNNKSLNPAKFVDATGVSVPSWEAMINKMHLDFVTGGR